MARTVTQIYNQMLAEKAKYQSLDALTNTTSVAIWSSLMYACAVVMASFEQIQDVFKTELLIEAEKLPIGTKRWYADKALEYQDAYELSYDRTSGRYKYDIIDNDALLCKVSSCEDEAGNIVIKVAKDNGLGGLTNLDNTEISNVYNYFQLIKMIGPVLLVKSLLPDVMRLVMKIKVDNTIINSLGQSVASPTTYPIEDAIHTYISSFSLITFGSEFNIQGLIDAIQSVRGVINIKINSALARANNDILFNDILATDMNTYQSLAGYMIIDPTFTLRNNITYI
jgi:hypothetical protein